MAAESKKKLVDDLSDQVETRVKKLAITAARSAVRKLWNSSFAAAIENEITCLYKTSFEDNPVLPKDETSEAPAQGSKDQSETVKEQPNVSVMEKSQTQPLNQTGSQERDPVQAIDKTFIAILEDFADNIMALTKKATEYILDVSNSFMDERAQSTLQDFHELYFGNETKLQTTANEVNAEVDHILDDLKEKINAGQVIGESDIDEGEAEKANRLSISGLQKRLETIISLDEGIKEKLIPVLHSMQFEDFLNQRLSHIKKIWNTIMDREDAGSSMDVEALKESLSKVPTSVVERESFYKIVLKQDAPGGITEQQSLVDILF